MLAEVSVKILVKVLKILSIKRISGRNGHILSNKVSVSVLAILFN